MMSSANKVYVEKFRLIWSPISSRPRKHDVHVHTHTHTHTQTYFFVEKEKVLKRKTNDSAVNRIFRSIK